MAPAAVMPKDPPPAPSHAVTISPVIVRVKRPCMLPIFPWPKVPGSLVPSDPSLPPRPYIRLVLLHISLRERCRATPFLVHAVELPADSFNTFVIWQ